MLMEESPFIDIQGVAKTFTTRSGVVHALQPTDLAIRKGEMFGILGFSGAGKSTLLRILNRLEEPTAGRVTIGGREITALQGAELRAARASIGMIFQQFNLVKRSKVITNVLAGRLGYTSSAMSLLNRFSRADEEAALQALARVGIRDKAYIRADQLSGGQQQRVGIARALMQEPELMLADEPVASLDPATSHSVMKYLEVLNKEDGITVLCSLHFLSLARTYASRVIALKDGKIEFDGLPKDIDEQRFKEIYGEDAVEVEIH